ncbi:hypothetical protein DSO57_1008648 [Entomophthora muscae]|uniref:Uncharacterized protein n=1 Tax=Entomophthora muscae TaxID=34485 RepID=A0ACC2SJU4_9FUNG|nr:hypothetical protein DSO57_1008648 [Entomophthora muscae]
MEDVMLDCLTIGSSFSACSEWGRLVNKSNLCLPMYSWTGMSRNSQLAWCQISSGSSLSIKAPSFHFQLLFHPHLPADSVPSAGTSNEPPGNQSLSSGSGRRFPE